MTSFHEGVLCVLYSFYAMSSQKQVLICQYRSCLAQGSAEVLAAFLANSPSDVEVVASECQGQCNLGATVRIEPDGIWYCRVKPEHVATIAQQHLEAGEPIQALLHPRFHPVPANP